MNLFTKSTPLLPQSQVSSPPGNHHIFAWQLGSGFELVKIITLDEAMLLALNRVSVSSQQMSVIVFPKSLGDIH